MVENAKTKKKNDATTVTCLHKIKCNDFHLLWSSCSRTGSLLRWSWRCKSCLIASWGEKIDLFRVKDEGGHWFGLLRFPSAHMQQVLQISGRKGLMIRTTRESPVEYGITWFQADISQDIAFKDHAGLILGRRGFGYRVPCEQMAAAKSAQGRKSWSDLTPQYTIQGLPPEMQSGGCPWIDEDYWMACGSVARL